MWLKFGSLRPFITRSFLWETETPAVGILFWTHNPTGQALELGYELDRLAVGNVALAEVSCVMTRERVELPKVCRKGLMMGAGELRAAGTFSEFGDVLGAVATRIVPASDGPFMGTELFGATSGVGVGARGEARARGTRR